MCMYIDSMYVLVKSYCVCIQIYSQFSIFILFNYELHAYVFIKARTFVWVRPLNIAAHEPL